MAIDVVERERVRRRQMWEHLLAAGGPNGAKPALLRELGIYGGAQHHGEHYQIPYRGPGATGLGKPLRSIVHGRPDLPIYLAAIGPKNVALAAEIADGWLPVFFSPERVRDFRTALEEGFARARVPDKRERFDVAPMAPVVVGADVSACRARVKPRVALDVGGMGRRSRTSTSTSRAATATRRRRPASRSCTWLAAGPRPRRPSPTRWSTRSPCAARPSGSASACRSGVPPG